MGKEIATQVQEAQGVPYRINPRRNTLPHIVIKLVKIKEKEKLLKAASEKWQIIYKGGFPGGAVVEKLPANAGDMGSSPGLGGSHMPWSNYAREPQLLSLRIWSLCSATREAAIQKRPAHRNEEWPPLAATGESPRTETKTQYSQK